MIVYDQIFLLLSVLVWACLCTDWCPQKPPELLGPLVLDSRLEKLLISQNSLVDGDETKIEWTSKINPGGKFKPEKCEARHKVAILIPYRSREEHLEMLLQHLHPILQRQQLMYQIFVIEQVEPEEFNRGSLFNIGFVEARKEPEGYDCFILHDVDLLPEDDRIMYTCRNDSVKHLSVAIDKYKYKLLYNNNFGGVSALTAEQFENSNGFSNQFYGWGGEDDDLFRRVVQKHRYKMYRYPANIAKYKMLTHSKAPPNLDRTILLQEGMDHNLGDEEGLCTLKYNVTAHEYLDLFTRISVQLPPAPPKKSATTTKPLLEQFMKLMMGP